MPTRRPRYTVTDTGEVGEMLDLAHRAWPDVSDRKQLLLRLAAEGSDALRRRLDEADRLTRRAAQIAAMQRAATLIDVDELLADAAWQ
ncbi:MAG TPA: hypothetical protein VHZ31_02750 [Solirubrobacteraceae bacterium]|jgi:hypothetical protein|nr:hypothetical protein [Solirubrobacteraceae bacterium]